MLRKIISELNEARDDAEQFQNGNKSAGVRLRKSMQLIIQAAKDVREAVLLQNKKEL